MSQLLLPSFTINLVLLSFLTNSLQRDKQNKRPTRTRSENEDSVGERHNGDKIQTNMPDQVADDVKNRRALGDIGERKPKPNRLQRCCICEESPELIRTERERGSQIPHCPYGQTFHPPTPVVIFDR
ncbi:hypothetical protein HID58_031578 [Brassica napus]|uniref:Uncharacterized protein n=1 Tax=Brassica napus TaxID=3708 RepID=A0ABQ8BUT6_BRANA|nr:hypothetical protein HID58_031578 [Brassica napus]